MKPVTKRMPAKVRLMKQDTYGGPTNVSLMKQVTQRVTTYFRLVVHQ